MNPNELLQRQDFTARILKYMAAKGYQVATGAGELNIVYVEGCDADGRPNADTADGWNDLRIVIVHDGANIPQMILCEPATTEPGLSVTKSASAKRRGGAARIQFGQWRAWMVGYHQGKKAHPALIQVRRVTVHRDFNQDGKRTGDALDTGLFGINQHGTSPRYKGNQVGNYSAGCSVGRDWVRHLYFIGLCKADPRYQADPEYIFTATYIDGDDLARVCPIAPPA